MKLEDKIIVRTQLESVSGAQSKVNFWIVKKSSNKVAAEGYLIYTMISIKTGKPVRIPEEIINRYAI